MLNKRKILSTIPIIIQLLLSVIYFYFLYIKDFTFLFTVSESKAIYPLFKYILFSNNLIVFIILAILLYLNDIPTKHSYMKSLLIVVSTNLLLQILYLILLNLIIQGAYLGSVLFDWENSYGIYFHWLFNNAIAIVLCIYVLRNNDFSTLIIKRKNYFYVLIGLYGLIILIVYYYFNYKIIVKS